MATALQEISIPENIIPCDRDGGEKSIRVNEEFVAVLDFIRLRHFDPTKRQNRKLTRAKVLNEILFVFFHGKLDLSNPVFSSYGKICKKRPGYTFTNRRTYSEVVYDDVTGDVIVKRKKKQNLIQLEFDF